VVDVNVALPDIERALDASLSDLRWVIGAYALTLAGGLNTIMLEAGEEPAELAAAA
jgi:hypothetical protein